VKYLVDVNVLSEGTKLSPSASAVNWLIEHRRHIFVNPIILGELEFGILILPDSRRRSRLQQWLNSAIKSVPVAEINADTARVWASLLAELRNKGRTMPVKDSLIAATARQYDLTLATRNVTDFRDAGIRVEKPFET